MYLWTNLDGFDRARVDKAEVIAGGEQRGGHVALHRLQEDTVLLQLAVGTDDIILTAHFSPDSPTVGIDIIDNPDEVRIIVNDRRVIVSGTTLPVNIYDIMGRREQKNSPLQPGVFIVRIGTTTRKIIVF